MKRRTVSIGILLAGIPIAQGACVAQEPAGPWGITAVDGITVGHQTLSERPTGCTVVLTGPEGMVGGVDVRGGAPGSHETE